MIRPSFTNDWSAARILMCSPYYFGVEYEINPWMNRRRRNDPRTAMRQWLSLRSILAKVGAEVVQLAPIAGLPDLVFTANAALIYRGRAILSRFRHRQRRPEQHYFLRCLDELGFDPFYDLLNVADSR